MNRILIKEAILATPNYKALIPPDDENSVNNSSSGLNRLQKLYSRIWNGEFPSTWNEVSIISIPKKGDDLSDCDNYRGISLINKVVHYHQFFSIYLLMTFLMIFQNLEFL